MNADGVSAPAGYTHSQSQPDNTVGQTTHWTQSRTVRAVAGFAVLGLGALAGLAVSFFASPFAAIIAAEAVAVVLGIAVIGCFYHHSGKNSNEMTYQTNSSLNGIFHSNSYEMVDVIGDGNCLFSAFVFQCPGWDAARLRREMAQDAANWCRTYNSNNLQDPFSIFTNALHTYLTVEDDIRMGVGYRVSKGTGLQAIATDRAWGDPIVSFFAARVLNKPVIIVDGQAQVQYAFDSQGRFIEGLTSEGVNLKEIQDLSVLNNFIVIQHVYASHFKVLKRT